jgi:hypothetical protein
MTMNFALADRKLAEGVQPGMAVAFGMTKAQTGAFQITRITPVAK